MHRECYRLSGLLALFDQRVAQLNSIRRRISFHARRRRHISRSRLEFTRCGCCDLGNRKVVSAARCRLLIAIHAAGKASPEDPPVDLFCSDWRTEAGAVNAARLFDAKSSPMKPKPGRRQKPPRFSQRIHRPRASARFGQFEEDVGKTPRHFDRQELRLIRAQLRARRSSRRDRPLEKAARTSSQQRRRLRRDDGRWLARLPK